MDAFVLFDARNRQYMLSYRMGAQPTRTMQDGRNPPLGAALHRGGGWGLSGSSGANDSACTSVRDGAMARVEV